MTSINTRTHLRQLLQDMAPEYRLKFDREKLKELEESYPEMLFMAEQHSKLLDQIGEAVEVMPDSSQTEKVAKEAARLDHMKGQIIERNNWINVGVVADAIEALRKSVGEFKAAGLDQP